MFKRVLKLRIILRWAFIVTGIVLAAQAGRLLHLQIKNQTKAQEAYPHKLVSYTVTLREVIHKPNGTTMPGPEYTYAVRSDGSVLMRSIGKGSQRSIYFSSGLQVDTNESSNTKSTIRRANEDPASWQRDPDSKCLNSLAGKPMTSMPERFLGEETIEGYRTSKIASGGTTSWHALDYGCALVKDRWDFSATEFSEKKLVALVAGEPDANLFNVPAHYREVTPSERILGANKDCTACNDHATKFLQTLDEDYKRLAAKP